MIELLLQLNIRHGGVVSLISKLVVFAPFPNYFELRQFAQTIQQSYYLALLAFLF